MQCGSDCQVSAIPALGGARLNTASVRGVSVKLESISPNATRHVYPLPSEACTGGTASYYVAEPTEPEAAAAPNTATLQALLRLRHLRATLFPERLFAQPAWDMLLELLECQLRRRRISVSGLYLAAGVPPATALRRLQDMEDARLIVRVCDPSDRRRQFVELTPHTLHQLQTFFRHGDVWQALRLDEHSVSR